MMRTVMESAGLVFWPIFSLILFGLFSLALVLWLYRRDSKAFYDRMAGMALGEPGTAGGESPESRR